MTGGGVTFGVVGAPGDGIRNGRINAYGTKESPRISCTRRWRPKQQGKTSNRNQRRENVCDATLFSTICNEPNPNRHHCSGSIRGHTEELCFERGVA